MARAAFRALLAASAVWLGGCGVVASVTDSYYRRKDERFEKVAAESKRAREPSGVMSPAPDVADEGRTATQPVHDIPPGPGFVLTSQTLIQ